MEKNKDLLPDNLSVNKLAELIDQTDDPDMLFAIAVKVFTDDTDYNEKEDGTQLHVDSRKLVEDALSRFLLFSTPSASMLIGKLGMNGATKELKLIAIDLIISRRNTTELKESIFLLGIMPDFLPKDILKKKISELREVLKAVSIRGNVQSSVSGVIEI